MKKTITILSLISLSACGGGGASQPSSGEITTELSGAQAFVIGNGLGGQTKAAMQKSPFVSLLAAASEKSLYEINEANQVKPVVFKRDGVEVPTTVSKSRRAGKSAVALEVIQEGAEKTLLVDSSNGKVRDVSAYKADYAQVRGNYAYMFSKDGSTKLHRISLDDSTSEEVANIDNSIGYFRAIEGSITSVSNDAAFLLDKNGNVIEPESDLLLCLPHCDQHYFYNANGDLFRIRILSDNSPSPHVTLNLYRLEVVNAALQQTLVSTQTQSFVTHLNTQTLATSTPYALQESRRVIAFEEGFFRTDEDNQGNISLTWSNHDWSRFTDYIVHDSNRHDFMFPLQCDSTVCNVISGEYVYWQSWRSINQPPFAAAGTKIYRMKFDGSSTPETVVDDPALQSFQVAGETVIYTTTEGTFAVGAAQPEELAGADLQIEQLVEMQVQ
jgi:hypothetical protein